MLCKIHPVACTYLLLAAAVGSYCNKKAGEELAKSVGPFFNASDLVAAIPGVLWAELKKTT